MKHYTYEQSTWSYIQRNIKKQSNKLLVLLGLQLNY